MTLRVHHAGDLNWRRIGDIPMGAMRDHIDASELEAHLAFHEPGGEATPQLMEVRLPPHALIAPHSHDTCEIYFLVDGALLWGDHALEAGGSIFIPAETVYSFRAGAAGARLLNIRSCADHSFRPPK